MTQSLADIVKSIEQKLKNTDKARLALSREEWKDLLDGIEELNSELEEAQSENTELEEEASELRQQVDSLEGDLEEETDYEEPLYALVDFHRFRSLIPEDRRMRREKDVWQVAYRALGILETPN